ncbi:menaquinone-dependent protoporphyrinogen IX dehydrogenase [Ectothiorhodospiraceae bacterium BW-2]|nr:menaquinone-dependent protoporphyrinogen IX dehydrogenase [Ectothiorhodospiraceae bacterium BW-2]
MSKILIIFSTTDGHTQKICSRLQEIIENSNNQVTLSPISEADSIDLNSFDKIVIGASIRYGKHSPEIYKFINNNAQKFEHKPNAFFSVNVVARKPEKSQPNTNPYLQKFLAQITWKPKKLAVFAGKIEYQKYSFFDRLMIRLIMKVTHGPTDPKTNVEFTNWSQVDDFGQVINEM